MKSSIQAVADYITKNCQINTSYDSDDPALLWKKDLKGGHVLISERPIDGNWANAYMTQILSSLGHKGEKPYQLVPSGKFYTVELDINKLNVDLKKLNIESFTPEEKQEIESTFAKEATAQTLKEKVPLDVGRHIGSFLGKEGTKLAQTRKDAATKARSKREAKEQEILERHQPKKSKL